MPKSKIEWIRSIRIIKLVRPRIAVAICYKLRLDCFELSLFFFRFLIHNPLEDAQRVATEQGNAIATRKAERFEMLRELCRAAGQNHTAKAVFESFKQAATEKKVRYASEETAIATEDQVQKLLQVLTRLASTFSFVTCSV